MENFKKSIKRCQESLREAKRGQERLREAKNEAKKRSLEQKIDAKWGYKLTRCRQMHPWARLGRALGASWSVRGRLGGVLGPPLSVLGGSWKGLGESWRLSEGILEAFLNDILLSCAICQNSKKPRKTNGFSLIFEVPGGLWGLANVKKSIKRCQESL